MTSGVNPLDIFLQHIHDNIDKSLLHLAFDGHQPERHGTIDEKILDRVIRRRVLADITVAQGRPKPIIMSSRYQLSANDILNFAFGPSLQGDLYQIPPEAREYRNIVAIRDITYGIGYARTFGASPVAFQNMGNTVGNLSSAVLDSHTNTSAVLTPRATLWDGNVIQITPSTIMDQVAIECVLAYDENFTNFPSSMIQPATQLCLIATKQIIYTTCKVQVDLGQVVAGANIGSIRDIIDRYEQEGSYELYLEVMNKVKEGNYMDVESFRGVLKYFC